MPDPGNLVTVVLPCLNEEESLPAVLAAVPAGYRALVVDNNSTDDTAGVARRHGAEVVVEPRPGYGSAVHAGVAGATTEIVAVIDADGSMDARELPRLVSALDHGADLVTGRRRPVPGLHWPWVARAGTVVMSWRLPTRSGCGRSTVGLSAGTAGPRRSCRLAGGRARRQLRPSDGR